VHPNQSYEPVIERKREGSRPRSAPAQSANGKDKAPDQDRLAGKTESNKKPTPRRTATPEPVEYAFEGSALSLTRKDYDAWREEFSRLSAFDATLRRADEHFAKNPPRGGNIFLAVRRWLAKDNERAPGPKKDLGLDEFGIPIQPLNLDFIEERQRPLRALGVEF
jgi:hypothetical protein